MNLEEIADAIEAEWYAAPQLRDWHNRKDEPEKVVANRVALLWSEWSARRNEG